MNNASRLLFVLLLLGAAVAAQARSLPIPDPPSLGAGSYVLLDVDSGQVLASKNPDKHIKPASVTKLMTCYITFDAITNGDLSIDETTKVSKKAWKAKGSQMFLRVGNEVSVDKLLDGLITASGNDAAIALAQHMGGTTGTFVGYMNKYTERLGLSNSHFENVDGLPVENHYMSARDIAGLQAKIATDFPELYQKYFQKKAFKYNGIKQHNRNKLLWSDSRVDGGKTGHTKEAGFNLVVSAKAKGMRLVSAVTGTDTNNARNREADSLLNYGFRFFENGTFAKSGQSIAKVTVWKGDADRVPAVAQNKVVVAYPRGKRDDVKVSAKLPQSLTAPIQKGQKIGTLTIKYNDKLLKQKPLYAGKEVGEGGLFSRLIDAIWMMF
ncbi:D-alanyl-D-alanine carboxypeptidase family protein [Salinisphaera orenii]|uniref:D-alanyl-D-alanine carboxypeptidase family protein n=1 Tax=Salinisphaera orenii TaxID=856731 RepID=UPI000DBE3B8F